MKITIKANFNKQTKDSKKELVQFIVKGEDEKRPELSSLTREVVLLSIEGLNVELKAAFEKTTKDSTKTTLDFIVKGDSSAAQTFEFYKLAGSDVELTIAAAQMSMEEFKQVSFDDEQEEEEDEDQAALELETLE
ncbi:hypothetical protein [Paenibacillus harenae]|uniref:hypothetical protein n=1 Tax=Paenibacillus harenae TaxID=306543 RepID=UPI000407DAB9|nr:hypothetical protein [Paenibacillus harenae]